MLQKVLAFVLVLCFSGCSSRYYTGIHHFEWEGKSTYVQAVSSRKADKELEAFERVVLESLLSGNIAKGVPYLSDSLLTLLSGGGADSLNIFLFAKAGIQGRFRKIDLAGRRGLDEAFFKEPFEYYDAVQGRYILNGDSATAVLTLWFEKIDGILKVCGLGVVECIPVSKEQCRYEKGGFEYAVSYTRSVDRAGLNGRNWKAISPR